MTEYRIEPLTAWNRPSTKNRKPSTFTTKYNDTLKLLGRELDLLGAKGPIIVAVVIDRADIRNDGALRARAQVRHPGVAVTAETKYGPRTWATDHYETRYMSQGESWQANLHAIALTLGALRAVDRYGTTTTGEQYMGFRELGSAPGESVEMTVDAAAALIRHILRAAGETDSDDLKQAYRRARGLTHPDRNGGIRTEWDRVEQAATILRANGRLQ